VSKIKICEHPLCFEFRAPKHFLLNTQGNNEVCKASIIIFFVQLQKKVFSLDKKALKC